MNTPVIKGRKQTKKCAAYVKRMITGGYWKANEQLPALNEIASRLSISYSTVRKVIRAFEKCGIIENYGRLGFFLINPVVSKRKQKKSDYLTSMLKMNVTACRLLSENAKQFENWIVKNDSNIITGFNIVSGTLHKCSLRELSEAEFNPITLETVVSLTNWNYRKAKIKYLRQQAIKPLATIVFTHKKELGIDGSTCIRR